MEYAVTSSNRDSIATSWEVELQRLVAGKLVSYSTLHILTSWRLLLFTQVVVVTAPTEILHTDYSNSNPFLSHVAVGY